MKQKTTGFSLIELIVAILIGSILTSIALASFGNAQGTFAVSGAKRTYASLHARARAHAIERGETVYLFVDIRGDSSFIVYDGAIQEKVRFGEELAVDMKAEGTRYLICMSPRGYADSDCGNVTSAVRFEFWQAADSTSLWVLPLGQLVGT